MLQTPHLLRRLPGCWSLFFVLQVFSINAQSWQWVERIGGFEDEAFQGLAVNADGGLYFAGSYEESFVLGSRPLPTYGGEDLFVAATDEKGAFRWTATAGSTFDDAVAALTIDSAGAVICSGAFWQEAEFGEERIRTAANLKGIFLAKYDPTGALRWVRAIDGTMLKEVTDIATDEDGNIYLSGFFEGQLLVDTTVLEAAGVSDLFLLKFDGDGELLWATRDGYSGDTRAFRLALAGEEVVLTGFFNDTTVIAGQRLTANTFDRDVFVARYDRFGQAKWARKAGGVHDDEVTGLTIGDNGDIYLAGYLVGVMTLDENLQIQSKTGQSDFYLLRYNAEGEPLMGRAMGGDRLQQATDLVAFDGGVAISGIYQGTMTIDEVSVSAGAGFGSFIAHYDESGKLNWIKNLPTAEGAFITHLSASPDGALVAGGAFRGDITFDNISFSADAQFDLFLGKLATQTTSVELLDPQDRLRLFPNPADGEIFLEAADGDFEVRVYDSSGRPVLFARNARQLAIGHLSPGVYFVKYTDERKTLSAKVVIRR